MKVYQMRRTVAGCVLGAGCAVGVPAVVHAQATGATTTQNSDRNNAPGGNSNDKNTATPIKHVIYIIGENRTFDHAFATYVPRAGQTVWNLLSEGIINADGTPGKNFSKATQYRAFDSSAYSVHPPKGYPWNTLPSINTDGAPTTAPFSTDSAVAANEPALFGSQDTLLTTGGTGQPGDSVDKRFPAHLPNGPFQISRYASYDSYTSSPVHRFFQMWQQTDCDVTKATAQNPSGCQNDLWPLVEVSIGAGSNGKTRPANATDQTTGEGSTSMGFWNVQAGDAPYFTYLANEYALNDNFHQAIEGGTGANHIAVGYGTTIFYADSTGAPTAPPSNQIENPNAASGTNDWYAQDGYSGGSYVNCADTTQPGVASVQDYLNSLPYKAFRGGDCRPGAYYLVNNYNPGYLGTGVAAPLGANVFTIPPSSQRNLALLLNDNHVSWKYYGEGWANGTETGENSTYCNICNPFLYSKQVMTDSTLRSNLQDITNLYNDIQNGTLPAVSIVKPDGYLDGHPASSKWDLYEAFVRKIVDMVLENPKLFKETAIMITEDEGGGYYDSGYIQPIDFFGDGTRIPLIVVSPFSKGLGMVHSYGDHVSFDKFVEANWGLESISSRSRDNLPNPITARGNPYVPTNSPAIGDLMDMFDFHHGRSNQ
jgi:phospholipase C